MNLMALGWLCLFVILSVMTFRRSSYGIALYLLTFFGHPPNWWWGSGMLNSMGIRWNLVAALIFATAAFLDARKQPGGAKSAFPPYFGWILFYGINATLVHLVSANNPDRSFAALNLLWKQIGLLYLIWLSIREEFDFKVFLYSILMGSFYIGYEVVINNRGHFAGSRLEGIGVPGAAESNYLAGLLCLALVLGGWLLFFGSNIEKIFAFCAMPFIMEVVLRCNSRGAFLGLIAGAMWLIVLSRGKVRRYAILGVTLGGIGAFMMIGDQRIIDRFLTTFSSEQERDRSSQSRIEYWTRAMAMIADHPQGSGAEAAFKSELGMRYLKGLNETTYRAVHNGYLDIAAGWGVQGLALYLFTIVLIRFRLQRVYKQQLDTGDQRLAFMAVCLDAALLVQLIVCMFISSLDGEWFFWWMGLALAYVRVFALVPASNWQPPRARKPRVVQPAQTLPDSRLSAA